MRRGVDSRQVGLPGSRPRAVLATGQAMRDPHTPLKQGT